MSEIQSIKAFRDYSLKLQPNIRREVNKLANSIESDVNELEAENAKLKERLKLRPHDLMHRLDELEAERDEYYDGYLALMNRNAELAALMCEMWVELCCASSGFNVDEQIVKLGKRMSELGIEVDA